MRAVWIPRATRGHSPFHVCVISFEGQSSSICSQQKTTHVNLIISVDVYGMISEMHGACTGARALARKRKDDETSLTSLKQLLATVGRREEAPVTCRLEDGCCRAPPVVPFDLFFGDGSPNKIGYSKKGTLILTSLPEDLACSSESESSSRFLTFVKCTNLSGPRCHGSSHQNVDMAGMTSTLKRC